MQLVPPIWSSTCRSPRLAAWHRSAVKRRRIGCAWRAMLCRRLPFSMPSLPSCATLRQTTLPSSCCSHLLKLSEALSEATTRRVRAKANLACSGIFQLRHLPEFGFASCQAWALPISLKGALANNILIEGFPAGLQRLPMFNLFDSGPRRPNSITSDVLPCPGAHIKSVQSGAHLVTVPMLGNGLRYALLLLPACDGTSVQDISVLSASGRLLDCFASSACSH